MTSAGRLAQGERALAHTETYVAACRRVATVSLTPERVDELYRAEDGLRLAALDADGAALAAAAAAAEGALDIERAAVGALSAAWQGGTGSAATDFLNRQYQSAAQVVSGLRMAADTLRGLRAELTMLVDTKIDAAVRIDDRRAGQRGRWLIAARAVLDGVAEDAAIGVVRGEITPYVAADIAGDWVTAMTSATESVRAAYDGAIRSLTERAAARFEFPAIPTAGAPPVRAARSQPAPAPAIPTSVPEPTNVPAASATPLAAPSMGAIPADFAAMPAPAWPQPLTDAPPLRRTRDGEPDDTTPDDTTSDEKKPDDEERVEARSTSDSETAQPVALPSTPPEPIVAQEVPNLPPDTAPPTPLTAEAPTETPADAPTDERTPCEIAADELPQVGE